MLGSGGRSRDGCVRCKERKVKVQDLILSSLCRD